MTACTSEVDRIHQPSISTFRNRYLAKSPVVIEGRLTNCKTLAWTAQTLNGLFDGAKLPLPMNDDEFKAFCEATVDTALLASKDAAAVRLKGLSFWLVDLNRYFDAILHDGALCRRLPSILNMPLSAIRLESYLMALKLDIRTDCGELSTALQRLSLDLYLPGYLAGVRDYRLWFTPARRDPGILHADGHDNLNAQLRGRKDWRLYHPERVDSSERAASLTCVSAGVNPRLYAGEGAVLRL